LDFEVNPQKKKKYEGLNSGERENHATGPVLLIHCHERYH
jgi:hypothetical protein